MAPVTRSARTVVYPDSASLMSRNDGHLPPRVIPESRNELSMKTQKPKTTIMPTSNSKNPPDTPPTYTIDLSLPPVQRYVEVAKDFKHNLVELIQLFDEVVLNSGTRIPLSTVKSVAKLFLRRVHSNEQTEELRGISKAIGVDMYLLVSFNTLLDLFMGCTSGGVRVGDDDGVRMMHFRTLDWAMDVLRKVVVMFEFVDRPKGKVVARTVSYVGFVGVLTGVRQGLSLSLNFRACHNNSTSLWSNVRYHGNQLAVLLGLRPSIASILRDFILVPSTSQWKKSQSCPTLDEITNTFPSTTSTSCYIIASDGHKTTIFEKDLKTATTRSSTSFITATNHDVDSESEPQEQKALAHHDMLLIDAEFLDESIDRKRCMEKHWMRAAKRYIKKHPGAGGHEAFVKRGDVEKWMIGYPIANECTHYAVIMDALKGEVVWFRRWLEW